MTETACEYAKNILIFEEGFSDTPYRCTAKKLTIGYGTNLEDGILPKKAVDAIIEKGKISKEYAAQILDDSVETLHIKLEHRLPFYRDESFTVQAVLICMAYQMGFSDLMEFKNTLGYLKDDKYAEAAEEMLDSEWYRDDTPERAQRMSNIIRKVANNKFFEEYGPHDESL
ncbi:MAG: lysozyme [Candidatus Zapsychrus exili]|nr:lysozyme [Candidatus Zapsychrus exili]